MHSFTGCNPPITEMAALTTKAPLGRLVRDKASAKLLPLFGCLLSGLVVNPLDLDRVTDIKSINQPSKKPGVF